MQDLVEKLENEFGTKVTVQGEKVLKTTVPSINGNEILGLGQIYLNKKVDNVELKRSGTSITVLVKTK